MQAHSVHRFAREEEKPLVVPRNLHDDLDVLLDAIHDLSLDALLPLGDLHDRVGECIRVTPRAHYTRSESPISTKTQPDPSEAKNTH